MSSKKAMDIHHARLQALKKLGIAKSIPSRGKLTDKQKEKVRTEFKKYHAIANAAPGEYKVQSVKRMSDSDKKALQKSGYQIINDKIYLPKQGYDSASVKQVWAKDENGNPIKTIEIQRKKGERKTEIELIGKPTEKLEWRDRLVREYQAGKFKEGDFIGAKLFDNGRFERETTISLDVLFRYLEHKNNWHDRDKQKLMDNLHLVKLSVRDYRDLASDEDTKVENHTKYIKKKNRKRTHTNSIIGRKKK